MAKLGQHFLIRKDATPKIIRALELEGKDCVIEIGPGHGELSLPLAEQLSRLKGNLIMIEKDAELARSLNSRPELKESKIILGDALEELPVITEKIKDYKIVGNLPYYISGYFFRTISELKNKPQRIVVMIQKEVGERLAAKPPHMNRLAASVQFWGEPKIIMHLGSKDFRPAPKVDSVVVSITARRDETPLRAEAYYEAVRKIFRQPRKNILNNLFDRESGLSKTELIEKLAKINLSPEARPQNLDIEQICAVARLEI